MAVQLAVSRCLANVIQQRSLTAPYPLFSALASVQCRHLKTKIGTVKLFNAERGYGFIACEGRDVFVHQNYMQPHFAECDISLSHGQEVQFDLDIRGPGLKTRALNVRYLNERRQDNSHLSQEKIAEVSSHPAKSDRCSGIVKFFNAARGYGFITCNGEDLLFHRDYILGGCDGVSLVQGDEVEFDLDVRSVGIKNRALRVTHLLRSHLQLLTHEVNFDDSPTRHVGVVRSFDLKRGYGFISFHGEDIFVHRDYLEGSPDVAALVIGEEVEFDINIRGPGIKKRAMRVSKLFGKPIAARSQPEQAAASTRCNGVVKSFDVKKGFGFILYNSYQIFVHRDYVKGGFYGVPLAIGEEVEFDLDARGPGIKQRALHVTRKLGLQLPLLSHQDANVQMEVSTQAHVERQLGCVKAFDAERGYGFITCQGEDIFVHRSYLNDPDCVALVAGENVEFDINFRGPGIKKRALRVTRFSQVSHFIDHDNFRSSALCC